MPIVKGIKVFSFPKKKAWMERIPIPAESLAFPTRTCNTNGLGAHDEIFCSETCLQHRMLVKAQSNLLEAQHLRICELEEAWASTLRELHSCREELRTCDAVMQEAVNKVCLTAFSVALNEKQKEDRTSTQNK